MKQKLYNLGNKKMFSRYITTLILTVSLLIPINTYSASYDVGLAATRIVFLVDDTDGTDLGEMTEGNQYYPYISARFAQNTAQSGNWGFFYGFDIGYFKISKQQINDDKEVDLGTSVRGTYAYLTPTIFYNFLNHDIDSSLVVGIGAGLGYLNATGDVILTKTSARDTISINVSDIYISAGIYFEYVNKGWVFKVSGFGPRITDDEYDYQLIDVKIVFGKRYDW